MTAILAAIGNGKLLWYLTRGSGAVALVLLTAGVLLGVSSSVRWRSERWPRFLVSGLHRNVTLLAVVFVAVHVVTTVVDRFAPIGYLDAFVPFLSPYRPIWLGLGAVAFDLLLALVATSLLRAWIGFRVWRAVHWLAYASWPVAVVHSLGTGSDARFGWLQGLGVACTASVVLAVLWRAGAASGRARVRVAAALLALATPLALVVWARSGPLRRGWAARAGTPARLVAAPRTTARVVAEQPVSGLPRGRFDASLQGTITQSSQGGSLVVIRIEAVAHGGFDGRVHVALRGVPAAGGGVQMVDSRVGLLPTGAAAWAAGSVVGLSGQQIFAEARAPGGPTVRFVLALRIDAAAGRVQGVMRGTPE